LNVYCVHREKKKEKERDELWRRLGELEINYREANNSLGENIIINNADHNSGSSKSAMEQSK